MNPCLHHLQILLKIHLNCFIFVTKNDRLLNYDFLRMSVIPLLTLVQAALLKTMLI